jgi:hypothetical protein
LVFTFTVTALLDALLNLMVKLKSVKPVLPSAKLIASIEMVGCVSTGGRQQSVPPFLHEYNIKEMKRNMYFVVIL